MGELLDRGFQREILTNARDHYPQYISTSGYENDAERRKWLVNVAYLSEHGLLNAKLQHYTSGDLPNFSPFSITAKGMDFLADDGGLSAILNVVTVKLHDDTIRQILINRIEKAEGDVGVKASLVAKVKALPAEALGKITMDGFDAAMAAAPDLIQLLQDLFR